ncbi:ABC-2 family transporter protein [Actinomadura vinacea]|uniref:ABC-2 family transporter protein n=1 Tax=Actinomadura vinacea TaxID=115336 RepID=A0ABN3IGH8_9ACTN
MGVFPWVAWFAFRRHTAYPLSGIAEALTNTAFGFIRAYILIALWHERPSLGGYDVTDAVTFAFLTQALVGPVQLWGGLELTERIRSGDVAIDLHRPADLQAWWLADDLARGLATLLLRGGPPLIAGVLVFQIRIPGPGTLAAFALAVMLGVLVGFGIRYAVALGTFWLHDDRGLQAISLILAMFFSGLLLPLVAFPGRLGTLAQALPWAALIQVPADVFLGKHTGAELVRALAFQALWAVVLLAAGRAMTLAARRRLVIDGG